MHLLSLPEEVLLSILSLLSARDILAFATVSRHTKSFFDNSSRLQYIVELESAGCLDPSLNHSCTRDNSSDGDEEASTTISEKLNYLRTREARWRELDLLKNAKSLPLEHGMEVSIYDLSAGVFGFAEVEREERLHYVDLREVSKRGGKGKEANVTATSSTALASDTGDNANGNATLNGTVIAANPPGQNLSEPIMLPPTAVPWQMFPFDGAVADIGLALKEHDLIVLVTYNRMDTGDGVLGLPPKQEIFLNLHEFTTRRPHPLAKESVIKLAEVPSIYRRPSPAIEAAGKYVVIILTYPRSMIEYVAKEFFIINWQTGQIIHKQRYLANTYCSLAFVTPSLIVLPNLIENSLDLVYIFTGTDGVEHVCWPRKLYLPELTDNFKLHSTVCRGDPNPTEDTPDTLKPKWKPNSDLDGHSHTAHSTETQTPDSGGSSGTKRQWGASGYGITADPLRAIISFKFIIVHERDGMALGPAVNVVVHRSTLASLAAVGLEVLGQAIFHGKTSPENSVLEVDWEDWGPRATRWRLEDDYIEWVTTTAGQRQVSVSLSSENPWRPIIVVRDYNPYEVRRVKARSKLAVETNSREGENIYVDSVHGARESDSEDEDEFGMGENAWITEGNDDNYPFLHGPGALPLDQIDGLEVPEGYLAHTHVGPEAQGQQQHHHHHHPINEGHADVDTSEPNAIDSPSTYFTNPQDEHDSDVPPLSADPPPSSTSSLPATGLHDSVTPSSQSKASSSSPQQTSSLPPNDTTPARSSALKRSAIRVRDTIATPSVRYYKKGQLRGGLPCVEYTIEGSEHLYSGLLMDEERIIGYLEDADNPDQVERMTSMSVFSMYP